jgi:hypothetical protein
MLAGVQRQGNAGLRRQIPAPHAAAIDNDIGLDGAGLLATLPGDAGDLAPRARHGGNLDAFDNFRTVLPRTLGQRHGDIGGIALPVKRQMHRRLDVIDIEMRIHLFDVVGTDLANIDIESAGQ